MRSLLEFCQQAMDSFGVSGEMMAHERRLCRGAKPHPPHLLAEEGPEPVGRLHPRRTVLPVEVNDLAGGGFVHLQRAGYLRGEGAVVDVEVGLVVEAEGTVVERARHKGRSR